jgi:hypothetical protein
LLGLAARRPATAESIGNVPVSVPLVNDASGVNPTTMPPTSEPLPFSWMCAPVIALVSPVTLIVTLMFERVESNVTVALPHPVLVVGDGRSCEPVMTTPYVCACASAAAKRNTTAATPIRRAINKPPPFVVAVGRCKRSAL